MARALRVPARGLVHHSDRGRQYACFDYQKASRATRHPLQHAARQIRPVKRRVLETGEVVMQGQGKALLAGPEIRKAYLGE